jgi:hypothetical protein
MASDDPRSWRLDVPQNRIDLYMELANAPRGLTSQEAQMMVELVDAWRALEQKKHIALMSVRSAGSSSG